MTSMARVLDRLDRVTGHGNSVKASCPVPTHGQGRGDRNPSLSVTYTDGKVLLNCMNSCHPQDVLLALGLQWADLWDEPITNERGVKVAEWKYQHRDGTVWFTVERWEGPNGKRFVQRVPGHDKAGYPPGFKPCLYNIPAVLAQAQAGGEVWIVEGEKSVSAARSLGLVASCSPNGAKAWRDYYWTYLNGCSLVNVVADNDADGQRYAASVCANLRSHGIKCRTFAVAVDSPKADLYDHVIAGYKVADLRPVNLNRLRPSGSPLSALVTADYPPVRWAVPGLIPAGLTLFGGSPKLGKSFVVLDLSLGVACGGLALNTLHCEQGDVLLLSLDNDTERRIKERTLYLFGGTMPATAPPVEVHTDWPTGPDAVTACREWANEVDNPLMVVIDTLVKVEPMFDGNGVQNAYGVSVEVLSRWAQFAIDMNLAVVAVHHDRKRGNGGSSEDEDWIDRFTGSRGLTAAAQTLLMLDAVRGASEGMLRVSGRDIETGDLAMHRVGRSWAVLDRVSLPEPARV
jgi:hypothetical protein